MAMIKQLDYCLSETFSSSFVSDAIVRPATTAHHHLTPSNLCSCTGSSTMAQTSEDDNKELKISTEDDNELPLNNRKCRQPESAKCWQQTKHQILTVKRFPGRTPLYDRRTAWRLRNVQLKDVQVHKTGCMKQSQECTPQHLFCEQRFKREGNVSWIRGSRWMCNGSIESRSRSMMSLLLILALSVIPCLTLPIR